jgi:prolyl-tRNA synthetase
VTARRRDSGEEVKFELESAAVKSSELLGSIQEELLIRSTKIKEESTREAVDYDQFKQIIQDHKGFVKVFWNDNPEVEKKIKEETMAISRCLISEDEEGVDFYTGEPSKTVWLFAQAY